MKERHGAEALEAQEGPAERRNPTPRVSLHYARDGPLKRRLSPPPPKPSVSLSCPIPQPCLRSHAAESESRILRSATQAIRSSSSPTLQVDPPSPPPPLFPISFSVGGAVPRFSSWTPRPDRSMCACWRCFRAIRRIWAALGLDLR